MFDEKTNQLLEMCVGQNVRGGKRREGCRWLIAWDVEVGCLKGCLLLVEMTWKAVPKRAGKS